MTSMNPTKEEENINRRTFFKKSTAWSTALTLLAFPGIISRVLAKKENKSKEEVLKELSGYVDKFLPLYGSCSQSSFAALNKQFALNADNTIRALKPFSGGVVHKGETCGAVSGALLAIGFFFEPVNQKGKERIGPSMKYGTIFFDRFKKEFGSTRCWGVQEHQYGRHYDSAKPEEKKLFKAAAKSTGKCKEVIKKAVYIACDIILENSKS